MPFTSLSDDLLTTEPVEFIVYPQGHRREVTPPAMTLRERSMVEKMQWPLTTTNLLGIQRDDWVFGALTVVSDKGSIRFSLNDPDDPWRATPAPLPDWTTQALIGLTEQRALPVNWDSYGG